MEKIVMSNGVNIGKIVQIIGVVVDAEFPKELPAIYDALEIKFGEKKLILETAQHLGSNRVRAVAMDSTDGLKRGMEVIDTGKPIAVPVGDKTLGRMFNVLGEPIDEMEVPKGISRQPIHKNPPTLKDQSTKT